MKPRRARIRIGPIGVDYAAAGDKNASGTVLASYPATSPTAAKLRRDAALDVLWHLYSKTNAAAKRRTEELASRQRAFRHSSKLLHGSRRIALVLQR